VFVGKGGSWYTEAFDGSWLVRLKDAYSDIDRERIGYHHERALTTRDPPREKPSKSFV
jgi:hypothetical protein